jgi:hypothetical protein
MTLTLVVSVSTAHTQPVRPRASIPDGESYKSKMRHEEIDKNVKEVFEMLRLTEEIRVPVNEVRNLTPWANKTHRTTLDENIPWLRSSLSTVPSLLLSLADS